METTTQILKDQKQMVVAESGGGIVDDVVKALGKDAKVWKI